VTIEKQSPIVWSPYQQAIFSNTILSNSHLAISATAGSSKTTVLVEVAKRIPYNRSSIFMAYNRHIVAELTAKLPSTTQCKTLHAIGLAILKRHFGEVKLYDKKQIDFIEPHFRDETNNKKKWKTIFAIDQVMRLARASMTEPTQEALNDLMNKHALYLEETEMIALARSLRAYYDSIRRFNRGSITIDFQDMISIPVMLDLKSSQYDFVLVDEAQDMSELDRRLINKLVKPITGRRIIVGDPRQAIYSWRGADIDSFEKFASEPNTLRLPLSISYRCPRAVVAEAQTIYPEIEPWEHAEEGLVEHEGQLEMIQEGDLVLCRNNRPLFEVLLYLIDKGVKAYILGKDLEVGLLNMLKHLNGDEKCADILDEFVGSTLEKLSDSLKEKGIKSPDKHPKYTAAEEKLSIIAVCFRKFNYVWEVEEFLSDIFEDEDQDGAFFPRVGAKLSTIHKAKGMESDRVFVVDHFDAKPLIPSQYAVTEQQLISEENLRFVSRTRAKKEMYFLHL
jgi:DNA helicase-2/ATP-dependent DNA helicase PcrA